MTSEHLDARRGRPSALSHPWAPRLVRLRLVTGLVLFIYATTHLANHALGLISLAAMEQGRHVFLGFWRLPPVEIVLLLSLVLHAALGLHRLWERRGLRLAPLEAAQLALGLMIPSWLVVHILGTRWLSLCCGVKDSYAYFLDLVWPGGALQQAIMLIIVWLHGCIGIRAWLRLKPFYHALRPWLAGGAVLLPTLALTGYLAGGRDVALLRAVDPRGLGGPRSSSGLDARRGDQGGLGLPADAPDRRRLPRPRPFDPRSACRPFPCDAATHRAPLLSRRQDLHGATRPDRARGQPRARHSPRRRLRRPWALLDLPGARRPRQ